jgi:putative inorganic carbon (HCO3(-)) transporter
VIRERLGLPQNLPPSVLGAILFYLAHLLFQAKIGIAESTAALMMVWMFWAVGKGLVRPSFHILYYPLALYGVVSTVSALAAGRSIHSFGEGMIWVKMLIFPLALILFREIPRVRQLALYAHALFGSSVALIGIVQYFIFDRRDLEHRITGAATHVMTYSGLLLPLSLLLLILWMHERKWWLGASGALVTLALLLTFTRSAWLGWIVAVFVLIVAARPRWIVLAVPLLVLFIDFMPIDLFSRAVSAFDTRQSSNLDRIRMFQAGVEIIRDYPLLGVGPGNVKEVYPLYRRHDAPRFRIPHLHDNAVQIWAERGVVGLAAYLILLALIVRECRRAWHGPGRPWAEAGLAVTVALAWAGLFEFNFGDTEVFYLFLDLLALTVASIEAAGEENERRPAPLWSTGIVGIEQNPLV